MRARRRSPRSLSVPGSIAPALVAIGLPAIASALFAIALLACRPHPEDPAETRAKKHGSAGIAEVAAAKRLVYPSGPGTFVDLVAAAKHGVVAIRSATPVKSGPAAMFPGAPETAADVALGTGFLIEAKGTYVLTNRHITIASNELRVMLPDGTEVKATVVGSDPTLDLSLLALDAPPANLKALPLGDSDDIFVGDWLVVLGNPFGDEVSATVGIVSATGQKAAGSLLNGAAMTYRMFIQTDARIHRGNSGGPVIDTAGQVIGVAVASGDRPTELSFVVPINRARDIFDALREQGTVARSWLGATVLPVTKEQAQQLGMAKPTGALVTGVQPNSPAIRANLRAGDVILKWNGREVDDKSLPWLVAQTPVGKGIPVVLWRNKAEFPMTIVTEKMPQ